MAWMAQIVYTWIPQGRKAVMNKIQSATPSHLSRRMSWPSSARVPRSWTTKREYIGS